MLVLWTCGAAALAVGAWHLVRLARDRTVGTPGLASVLVLPALAVMVTSVLGLRRSLAAEDVVQVADGLAMMLDARELGLYAVAPAALLACVIGAMVGVERPSKVAVALGSAAVVVVLALVLGRAALTGDLAHGLLRASLVLAGGVALVVSLARRSAPEARPVGIAAGLGFTLLVAAAEVAAGARFWFDVLYQLAVQGAAPEVVPWSGYGLGQAATAVALGAGVLVAWRAAPGWRSRGGAVGFLVGPALLLVGSPEVPMDQLLTPAVGEPSQELRLPE